MEESGIEKVSRKIVILDDFDHNLDVSVKSTKSKSSRPTIGRRHVRVAGDKFLLTGWKVPTAEEAILIVNNERKSTDDGRGVSEFVNKGTRYYLPEERIKSWESGVIDVKAASDSKKDSGGSIKAPNLTNVFVSSNSIWTVDPDEPILEETIQQYDQTRKLFWIIFLATSIVGALLLSCTYSWVYSFPDGNVSNFTMANLKKPKKENKANLRETYNTHALIMTTAVFVNIGASTVIYRLFPHFPILWIRWVHAILGFLGAFGSGAGLYFSYNARNFKKETTPFGMHACIGYITIALLQIQFLFGLIVFMFPCASFSLRVKIAPIHKFLGGFTFMIIVTTVITGIVAIAKILIPLDEHVKFPLKSIVLNLVGFCVICFAVLATILLTDHRFRRRSRPVLNITKEENITEFVNSSMAGAGGEGEDDEDEGEDQNSLGRGFFG